MRRTVVLFLAAAALTAATGTLSAQGPVPDEKAWVLKGLRTAFCIQFLMDSASDALEDLPPGYRPVPASEAADLHLALRGVVQEQPEFAAWSPSRLCFEAVDTVQTAEFTLADRSGRHPQLFATWTVLAAAPGGPAGDVALRLFANSDRLIRSARLAGQKVREARVAVGLVPSEDEDGVPSADERFQVKVGGTTVTWDGPQSRERAVVREPWAITWAEIGRAHV